MRTDVVTDHGSFARLGPAWDALAARTGLRGPFNGFGWSWEWWQALGGGRALRLVVASEGARVVGILPLFEERGGVARTLALVGSAGGGSDFLDALAQGDEVRRALVAQAAHLPGADLLVLDDLDEASPTVPLVRAMALEAGGAASTRARYPCPYLTIRGDWETFLKGVARRENLRRREKWLAGQPGFRVTCETTAAAAPEFLARFHRLHAARWHEDGGSQAFPDGRLVRFHERVCERFADEGRLRLWTMWVAGEAVAVAYTFDDGRRSLYYQSGFLPAWGAKSVGLVLLARYLEDAFARGLSEVDFLRGAEPYKREWTGEARRTVRVTWALTRRGRASERLARGRAAARAAVRGALPARLSVELSRAVRAARLRPALSR